MNDAEAGEDQGTAGDKPPRHITSVAGSGEACQYGCPSFSAVPCPW